MEERALTQIISKGILAPSADNLQPWFFELDSGRVRFYLDRERMKGFAETGLLMPYVSAGAVIENMRVAAGEAGWKTLISYFPASSDPAYVAELRFERDLAPGHPHYGFLEKRVTNRQMYKPRALAPEAAERLMQMAQDAGLRLVIKRREERDYPVLSRMLGAADQMRFEVRRLHEEFMEVVRFNGEAKRTQDGLPVRSLEAGPGAGTLFKLMRSWPRMRALNFAGFSRLLNCMTQRQMLSSGAAVLLVAPHRTAADYVRGGEGMQRLWHEMTAIGLAAQPMEALPIFIVNLLQGDMHGFDPAQVQQIREWKRLFYLLFNVREDESLILLWRVGQAGPVSARSLRRPVETFIRSHENSRV